MGVCLRGCLCMYPTSVTHLSCPRAIMIAAADVKPLMIGWDRNFVIL